MFKPPDPNLPILDMATSPETYPDFSYGPESCLVQVEYCFAGPSSRTACNPASKDLHERYGLVAKEFPALYPPHTTLRLEELPDILRRPDENPTSRVKVHYRILHAESLMVLTDPTGKMQHSHFVIDTAKAQTAMPRTLSDRGPVKFLFGDTEVALSYRTGREFVMHEIVEAISNSTDLIQSLNTTLERQRWRWVMFAECGMLSERVTSSNWTFIREAVRSNGWWFRVYLIEVEPRSEPEGFVWTTQI